MSLSTLGVLLTAKLLACHRRGAENAEEIWNLCELRASAVRKANNTQQGDHRTTKGTESREKHESGRCFRAFRAISWYSWCECGEAFGSRKARNLAKNTKGAAAFARFVRFGGIRGGGRGRPLTPG